MSTRSQDKRFWLGGGAVAAVAILLIGWFMVIHPQLSSAAATHSESDSAQLQIVLLQAKNTKLKKQNEDAAALRASLAAALAQLPSDGGLPAFTRQLSAQATANSVALTSVIIGAATPLTAPTAAVAATTEGGIAPAAAPAAASSDALVQIPVSVSATGLGRNDMAFLKAIQVTGPRRALVTASQLAPSGGGAASGITGPCTLTLTLTIFSAPISPTAQAALAKLLTGK